MYHVYKEIDKIEFKHSRLVELVKPERSSFFSNRFDPQFSEELHIRFPQISPKISQLTRKLLIRASLFSKKFPLRSFEHPEVPGPGEIVSRKCNTLSHTPTKVVRLAARMGHIPTKSRKLMKYNAFGDQQQF